MTTPRVTVVVPVRDDPVRLARCLAALEAQTLPRDRWEAVVVDDDSAPELVPVLPDRPGLRLLRQAHAGSYAARNRAVAAARGEVLAFTDADCLPEPDWLERGLAALERCDVVAGAVEVFARGARHRPVELYDAVTAFPQERFVAQWGFGATADVLVRRRTFDAVGPFDARLTSGGDAEWGGRATAAGFRVAYAPEVRVRHPARATVRALVEKSARTAGGVERLGVLRDDVTPLPEALRRHLAAPAGRLAEARTAGVRGPELVGFAAAAALVGGVGAAEVLRGRLLRTVSS